MTDLAKILGNLKKVSDDMARDLEKITMAAAKVIEAEAQGGAPGDIKIVSETMKREDTICLVGVGPAKEHFYAKYLEFGTRPHQVKATEKKALTDGEIFAKKVEHPGLPARPFLRPALDYEKDNAIKAATLAAKKVIDG